MAQQFRACSIDQPYLLSPSVQDWLPDNHLARFIADVVSELDLLAIVGEYGRRDNRGLTAYHPEMMTRLLLYAYCVGQPSSRRIEQATYTDLAFRYLAANQHPDHDTLANFRRRHLPALAALFIQVLHLCREIGLVRLGSIAIDGTAMKANASRHSSYSYDDLSAMEKRWTETIDALMLQAEAADLSEGGSAKTQIPEELRNARARLEAIQDAKRILQKRAQQRLEAVEAAATADKRRRRGRHGKLTAGEKAQREQLKKTRQRARQQAKHPTTAYNCVDPDSRLMRDGATGATVQAYNAQAAVDDHAQIIVACDVSQDANDRNLLAPMVQQVEKQLGQTPPCLTADTGYWNTAVIEQLQTSGYTLLVPPERLTRHSLPHNAAQNSIAIAMRQQLQQATGRKHYERRRSTVEPVFGYTKQQRNFRRFSLRGHDRVRHEWALICLTHNLTKLFRHPPIPKV